MALRLDPGLPGTFLALGLMHQDRDELEPAQNAYRAAIQLEPSLTIAHSNLGSIYRRSGELEGAIACFRDALQSDPDNPVILSNLAVATQEVGDVDGALALYDQALEITPEDPEIRRNRGMALLSVGRFEEGWVDFEGRLETEYLRPYQRGWTMPQWTGQDLKGKSVYVHAEQGFGDTIQFVRFLPMLRDLGARVILECADPLHDLLTGMDGITDIVAPKETVPNVDYHSPLLSLPRYLGIGKDNIPAKTRYLGPPKSLLRLAQRLVEELPPGFRIGIAWRGNPDHINDHARSPGLEPLVPLFEIPDCVVVSLQKEHAAMDLAHVEGAEKIYDFTDRLQTFGDTASFMQSLDAVVSCDTAVLHLAGALGVSTFALLPNVAEWRWGVSGTESYWYPTMTLCRQDARGEWGSAVDKAIAGIDALKPTATRTS